MAQKVTVMPVTVTKSNAYGFESTSEIIAKELMAADKNFIPEALKHPLKLKNVLKDKDKALNLKLIKEMTSSDKTLVIMSYIADKNDKFYDVWDILKVSTDFNLSEPYAMEVKAILTDNKDGVILWQNTYHQHLNILRARNMTEAIDNKEKITSYIKNIIVQDIAQNIELRLNPKQIDYSTRVQQTEGSQEGIGLKYKDNIPVTRTKKYSYEDDFENRWRYDDSFSY